MSQGKKIKKREHHILPEFYLKGFVIEDDGPFIWVYKRGEPYNPGEGKITKNPYRISVGKYAERDYYASREEDGKIDFNKYEDILQSLENPADSVFRKLRKQEMITSDDKERFSIYLAQMYRRVPSYRESAKKLLPKIAETYTPLNPPPGFVETVGLLEIRRMAKEIVEEDDAHIQCQLKSFVTAQKSVLFQQTLNMRWQFFIAPAGKTFLTGDNPIYFPTRLGLNNKQSELSFPVSSKIAVVLSWHKKLQERFVNATEQIVKNINRRTAGGCGEICCCENAEWPLNLLNHGEFDFRPIY